RASARSAGGRDLLRVPVRPVRARSEARGRAARRADLRETARMRRMRLPIALVPLIAYLGVTIVAPALHGAASGARFLEHAAIASSVALLVHAIWLGLRALTRGR